MYVALAAQAALCSQAAGGDAREQPTPFTVWLDLPALASVNAPRPPLPIWLESVEAHPAAAGDPEARTTYRLRLRRVGALNEELLLRVFFHDSAPPKVSAWSETGAVSMEPRTLGAGSGLESSESVIVPVRETDYIDIETAGDGSTVRGALLATLKRAEILHALDFARPPEFAAPFQMGSPASAAADDSLLFGRVLAKIDGEIVRLGGHEDRVIEFEFDLEAQPLVAVVSFEILGADVSWPVEIGVNQQAPEAGSVALPDLADPGYVGRVVAMEGGMRFHYTGWLSCQRSIAGAGLKAGRNSITVSLPDEAQPAAIRNVAIQLKYNSQNLKYRLSPLQP